MARQLRLEFPDAVWHVTSRGNEQRDIVCDDFDRRQFVTLLARTVIDSGWRLHAWVLMQNHYHLLIETPEGGLSKGVKWLNQTYVQWFNARHDRVGHLFQGRFKGILVEREGHLLELIRYIVLNPVRCGAVRFAADYTWSNYGATAALKPSPPWLEVDWTLAQFCEPTRRAAHEAYRRFVADARGSSYNPWESLRDQIYLGSPEFREQMQRRVEIKS
ncbi:MAG: transposase, partial [Thermoanaerobaculia bacterium]